MVSILSVVAMRDVVAVGGALVLEAVRVDVSGGGRVLADLGSVSSRTAHQGWSETRFEFNLQSLAQGDITVKMRTNDLTVVH